MSVRFAFLFLFGQNAPQVCRSVLSTVTKVFKLNSAYIPKYAIGNIELSEKELDRKSELWNPNRFVYFMFL